VDALSPLNVQFERLAQSVAERVADLLRASVVVVDERGATVASSQAGLSRLLAEQIAGDGQDDVLRVPLRMGERSGEVIVGEPEMDLAPPRAVILIDAADHVLPPADPARGLGSGGETRVQRQAQFIIGSVVSFFHLPNDTICAYIGDGEAAVLKAMTSLNVP
jgi:hypothetical protein